ncbi:MAG: hypothetical protein MUF27_12980 [Acidobacteria bacterium]|jgi:hypothetical protein|nr:hypothetical protein [Acidobacteriota bacterium]
MSQKLTPADLGEPDLKVAGFQLWVHGRQFPDAEDYYDGNWLRVTAHCGASGASVWAQGAILTVTDIAGFGDQCAAMLSGGTNTAALDPLELELKVSLEAADGLGHVRAQVELSPDHLLQAHRFEFAVDQTYLPGIIRQCAEIVEEHPIRGQQDREGV